MRTEKEIREHLRLMEETTDFNKRLAFLRGQIYAIRWVLKEAEG